MEIHFTPEKIDQMMKIFKDVGIKRVYWQHYGGARANLGFWKEYSSTNQSRATLQSLKGMPIKIAVEKAKKHGLELYAVIRPYENGLSRTVPEGSPIASSYPGIKRIGGSTPVLMDFVLEHPEMRIKRKPAKGPNNFETSIIKTIKLIKSDNAPTRIKAANIEIWTSPDNYQYQKKNISFQLTNITEPAERDIFSFGKIVTSKGAPVKILKLEGLSLTDKYVLVTTNFKDEIGDFKNAATEMIHAYDSNNQEIPISIATSFAVWNPDRNFKKHGLAFDTGFGPGKITLDSDSSTNKQGVIAFCRGKNEYLPASLCEAYPEVREFWFELVKDCVDAGVDGIDFRVQNHSCWVDDPYAYGFNEPVVKEYQKQYGINILEEEPDLERLAKIRGEFYTKFLRSASSFLHKKGMKMQVHVNTDLLSPKYAHNINPFTYPRNIKFDWEQWINERIIDEVTLRSLVLNPNNLQADQYSQNVIKKCNDQGIPLHYNRYLNQVGPIFNDLNNEINTIHHKNQFDSFIIYEGKRLIAQNNKKRIILRRASLELCLNGRNYLKT